MHLGTTPWQFDRRDARTLQAQASRAEAMGYDSFWLPENHFNDAAIPDPLMLLAAVAGVTSALTLATTSYLLTLRHPLQAAEQVAVLDHLCAGRLILGVGRGFAPDMLKAFNVVPSEKRKIFESSLDVMRAAWAGEAVPVGEGREVRLNPLPVQRPHPPIWVAAFGPKALAQAGRLGLPYLASPIETREVLDRNYEQHREASAAEGLPPVDVVPIMRTVFVTENRSEAEAVRAKLGQNVTGSRLAPDAEVDDWAVVGDAGFVAEALARYRDVLGMTHLVATRLRVGGVPEERLQASLETVARIGSDLGG